VLTTLVKHTKTNICSKDRNMSENKSSLARLLDEAAVRDATARFADSATRGDYDAFRALWADGAEWVIGGTEGQPFERRANGVEDIVSLYRTLREERDYFVQFAVQGPIEITGDIATASCVCQEAARGPGESYYRTTGVWTDRLRRADDGWVFTSRAYRYLWLDLSPFSGEVFPETASE
jgi:ketosteroid isomerase-like protein